MEMNEHVLRGMPEHVLFSADPIAPGGKSAALYPAEFLNSLNLSGLPLHEIKLKAGAAVMLLRTSIRTPASATAPASSSPPSTLTSSRVSSSPASTSVSKPPYLALPSSPPIPAFPSRSDGASS